LDGFLEDSRCGGVAVNHLYLLPTTKPPNNLIYNTILSFSRLDEDMSDEGEGDHSCWERDVGDGRWNWEIISLQPLFTQISHPRIPLILMRYNDHLSTNLYYPTTTNLMS